MPEGHTIHRVARRHRSALAGEPIATASPQGRFSAGASHLNGRVLKSVDAHGKHLFYRWEGGATLHIHLGLFGKFRMYRTDPPLPSENARLTMRSSSASVYLSGPTICELIDPEEEAAIHARLGPDPLRKGGRVDTLAAFSTNLKRRRSAIGSVLLDQRAIAGVGNVYRAEVLYLTGIDPVTPANELGQRATERLWSTTVELLKRGEKAGRIVTMDPADVGARRRSDLASHERLYVYGRHGEPCRRCDTPISTTEMANRRIWWCGSCQSNAVVGTG